MGQDGSLPQGMADLPPARLEMLRANMMDAMMSAGVGGNVPSDARDYFPSFAASMPSYETQGFSLGIKRADRTDCVETSITAAGIEAGFAKVHPTAAANAATESDSKTKTKATKTTTKKGGKETSSKPSSGPLADDDYIYSDENLKGVYVKRFGDTQEKKAQLLAEIARKHAAEEVAKGFPPAALAAVDNAHEASSYYYTASPSASDNNGSGGDAISNYIKKLFAHARDGKESDEQALREMIAEQQRLALDNNKEKEEKENAQGGEEASLSPPNSNSNNHNVPNTTAVPPRVNIGFVRSPVVNGTLLHVAAGMGRLGIVKVLLGNTQQCNINAKMDDVYGCSPLHLAVAGNHVKVVQLLLAEPTIDVNAECADGTTPLHIAAEFCPDAQIINLLAEAKADFTRTVVRTSVVVSAKKQSNNTSKSNNGGGNKIFVLGALTPPKLQTACEESPNGAVARGAVSKAVALIKHGADPTLGFEEEDGVEAEGEEENDDDEEWEEEDEASQKKSKKKKNKKKSSRSSSRVPWVTLAANQGFAELLDLLCKNLKVQATINRRYMGTTALFQVCQLHGMRPKIAIPLLTSLIEHGKANPNIVRERDGMPPLFAVCTASKETAVVKYLVNKGHADPCLRMTSGSSGAALHAAIQQGSLELVRFFVTECGASPEMPCHVNEEDIAHARKSKPDCGITGEPPLMGAICTQNPAMVSLLIELGADPNRRLDCIGVQAGKTPLHLAVELADVKLVRALTRNGATPNVCTTQFPAVSPIHMAASMPEKDVLIALLDVPAGNPPIDWPAIEANDSTIRYAIAAAMMNGNDPIPIAKMLLKAGANIDGANLKGRSALDLAADGPSNSCTLTTEAKNALHKKGKDMRTEGVVNAQIGIDFVKFLVAAGANLNKIDANGQTPLSRAVLGGRRETVAALLANSTRKHNAELKRASTAQPLSSAAADGDASSSASGGGGKRQKTGGGTGAQRQPNFGMLADLFADQNGVKTSLLEMLIRQEHSDINGDDNHSTNNKATQGGKASKNLAITAKKGVNTVTSTASSFEGNVFVDIFRLLLEAGADPSEAAVGPTHAGVSLLLLCCSQSLGKQPSSFPLRHEFAKLLMKHACNVNAVASSSSSSPQHHTALHCAAAAGDTLMCEIIARDPKTNVYCLSQEGDTAVDVATAAGHVETAQRIIEISKYDPDNLYTVRNVMQFEKTHLDEIE